MTDEDPSASLEERKERFGQADHVRFYGDDFEERITGEGLHVETLTFHDVFDSDLLKAVGAATPEEVWLVSKSPDPTSVLTLEPAASALIRSTLQIEVEANSYQSDLQGLAQATLEMILLTRSNERLRQEIAELGSRYDWLAGRWPVRLGLRVKSSIRKAVDSVRNDKRR